jgi:hypothetical protein
MRGKRSKQYRKLMQQYAMGFGFREPYQVIVTSDIIEDAARFQMDLTGGLSRTLHGEIKPCMYCYFCNMHYILLTSPSDHTMLNTTHVQRNTQKRKPYPSSKNLRTQTMRPPS